MKADHPHRQPRRPSPYLAARHRSGQILDQPGVRAAIRRSRPALVSACAGCAHPLRRPLDLVELAARLNGLGAVRANEFALRFISGGHEITVFPDGRAIIKGTTDIGVARGIYSKYIGN